MEREGPPGVDDLLAHAAWLRRLARSLAGGAAAEDLVQDTWVAALTRPPERRESLRPWLRTVLNNLVRLRARGDRNRLEREQAADLPEPLPTAEELLARHETLSRLATLVRGLPEPYRSTVLLCYAEGLSPAEIARRQDVPAGTVRWRLKQGLDLLRGRLDETHAGNRRAWLLAFGQLRPDAHLTGGLLLMKKKIALVVGILVLMAGVSGVVMWKRAPGDQGPTLQQAKIAVQLRLRADAETRRGSIAGTVRAGARPLAGVLVTAVPAGRSEGLVFARTNGQGEYVLDGLPAGAFEVVAGAPGYVPTERSVRVLAGERAAGVDLTLSAGGHTLAGTVTDVGGGLIAGAQIRVHLERRGEALATLAVTDQTGRYRVTLTRGYQRFVVHADGYAPAYAGLDLLGDRTRDFRLEVAGVIAGRVVRGADAVPGALVRAECRSARGVGVQEEATTDAGGQFELRGLPPGTCSLFSSSEGFAGRVVGPLVVDVAARLSGVVVALEAGRTIRGHVRRASGPLPGAQIRLAERNEAAPGWRGEALSDNDGAFSLSGVLPGSYDVHLVGARANPHHVIVGGADVDGVVLAVMEPAVVRGVVLAADDRPAAGAVVSAWVKSQRAQLSGEGIVTRTSADGRFRLEVPEGHVQLRFDHATGGESEHTVGTVRAGETREVTLRLRRGALIHGVVRTEDGKPGAGLSVHTMTFRGAAGARTTTGPDGRFSAGPITPGVTAVVTVQHLPWWSGADNSTTKSVQVRDEADVHGVELIIPSATGVVRGTVLDPDGEPAAGAAIDTTPGRTDGQTVTAADGSFLIEGLPRGTYRVRAAVPGLPAAQARADVPSQTPVLLRLTRGRTLAGVVRGANGRPLSPYSIWADPGGAPPMTDRESVQRWVQAADGAFRLGPLPAGVYDLIVVAPDGAVGRLDGVALSAAADREDLEIRVGKTVSLTGRVVDFDGGSPLAGVSVRALAFGREVEASSGDDGRFTLSGLVPGAAARLSVGALGYHGLDRTWIMPTSEATRAMSDIPLVKEDRGRKDGQPGRVGLVVGQDEEGRAVVRNAIDGGPAAKAGLKPGDLILAVDGRDVSMVGLGGVTAVIRGAPGTPLDLRVRGADGTVRELRLVRM